MPSDDLLMLCEAGGNHVGITFDVANPLAVEEEPMQFARKIGPWIRNVHLKDYWVYATPSGYRLVRSPLGQGIVPFPELLPFIRSVAPDTLHQIELAALYARHIRLFEDDWWHEYPARDVREVLPALRGWPARCATAKTGKLRGSAAQAWKMYNSTNTNNSWRAYSICGR